MNSSLDPPRTDTADLFMEQNNFPHASNCAPQPSQGAGDGRSAAAQAAGAGRFESLPWIRRRSGHWHATLGRWPRIREEAEQPHVEPRPCSDRFVSFSKFEEALRWALTDIARLRCGSVYFCGPISARALRGEGVQGERLFAPQQRCSTCAAARREPHSEGAHVGSRGPQPAVQPGATR